MLTHEFTAPNADNCLQFCTKQKSALKPMTRAELAEAECGELLPCFVPKHKTPHGTAVSNTKHFTKLVDCRHALAVHVQTDLCALGGRILVVWLQRAAKLLFSKQSKNVKKAIVVFEFCACWWLNSAVHDVVLKKEKFVCKAASGFFWLIQVAALVITVFHVLCKQKLWFVEDSSNHCRFQHMQALEHELLRQLLVQRVAGTVLFVQAIIFLLVPTRSFCFWCFSSEPNVRTVCVWHSTGAALFSHQKAKSTKTSCKKISLCFQHWKFQKVTLMKMAAVAMTEKMQHCEHSCKFFHVLAGKCNVCQLLQCDTQPKCASFMCSTVKLPRENSKKLFLSCLLLHALMTLLQKSEIPCQESDLCQCLFVITVAQCLASSMMGSCNGLWTNGKIESMKFVPKPKNALFNALLKKPLVTFKIAWSKPKRCSANQKMDDAQMQPFKCCIRSTGSKMEHIEKSKQLPKTTIFILTQVFFLDFDTCFFCSWTQIVKNVTSRPIFLCIATEPKLAHAFISSRTMHVPNVTAKVVANCSFNGESEGQAVSQPTATSTYWPWQMGNKKSTFHFSWNKKCTCKKNCSFATDCTLTHKSAIENICNGDNIVCGGNRFFLIKNFFTSKNHFKNIWDSLSVLRNVWGALWHVVSIETVKSFAWTCVRV